LPIYNSRIIKNKATVQAKEQMHNKNRKRQHKNKGFQVTTTVEQKTGKNSHELQNNKTKKRNLPGARKNLFKIA